ncbi:MAG: hypothetical protein K2H98_07000 [Duncaniella sp.]|nr:hypothetical protein [Duncaniella sp.]
MKQTIDIDGLKCHCTSSSGKNGITYILYPADTLDAWAETAAEKFGVTIVVITGMGWQNVFSPWAAPGVPEGSPDFKGQSREFLHRMQNVIVPRVESSLGFDNGVERTLVGVSMSGLFALWQWMICDTFVNIASLSGSFWYMGFLDWLKSYPIPSKAGRGYFLLGDKESSSKIKAFQQVEAATRDIVAMLADAGIDVEFQSVPGNHFSDPLPRLEKALSAIYRH